MRQQALSDITIMMASTYGDHCEPDDIYYQRVAAIRADLELDAEERGRKLAKEEELMKS